MSFNVKQKTLKHFYYNDIKNDLLEEINYKSL